MDESLEPRQEPEDTDIRPEATYGYHILEEVSTELTLLMDFIELSK